MPAKEEMDWKARYEQRRKKEDYIINAILKLLREQNLTLSRTKEIFEAVLYRIESKNPIVEWDEGTEV